MNHLDVQRLMTRNDKDGFDFPEPESASYDVGYGKPPKATRFQPGRSGNPSGRPRGRSKSQLADASLEPLKALLLEEAYQMVTTRDGDRPVQVPVLRAVARSVVTKAAKGDARAQKLLLESVTAIEAEQRRERDRLIEGVVEYKVQGEKAIAEARAGGRPEPELLPHPDHLIIHPLQGTVISLGPWTREEKARWDETLLLKRRIESTLDELTDQQAADPDDADLVRRIDVHCRVIGRIDAFLRNLERVIVEGAGG
jgi:hypothetical protein